MGFKNGDGSAESGDVEKLTLPTNEPENKVRLDDADLEEDAPGERDEKVRSREDDDQPRRKDGTWAEKKAERGRDRKAAKAWETEKADYERRLSQMREEQDRTTRQMREEMDRIARLASGPQQQQDPVAAQLSDVERQLEQELALIEADVNRGYKHYNQLRRQEQKLITMQAIAERDAQAARNAPQRSPYEGRVPIIEAEFPWLQDRRYEPLAKRAMAYRNYLIQVQNKPDTLDTDREALTYAQTTFGAEYGITPPPARPTQRTRDLYAGPPSRGTAPRGDRDIPEEVDLGPMGQGHGLSPRTLARAVADAYRNRNGT